MISTVRIIELMVFYILSLSVGYLFLFAIASKFYRRRKYAQAEKMNRFAVLFPGEAHRPMTAPDGIPMHVKKAVAKIKIN